MRYWEITESHWDWNNLLIPRAEAIARFLMENLEKNTSPWSFTFPFPGKDDPHEVYLDMIHYTVLDEDRGNASAAFIPDRSPYPEIILYFPGWKPFPNLREMLVHELRHGLQYWEYPRYFPLRKGKFHYGNDPIEIDASFHQFLADVEKEGLDSQDFTNTVMAKLSGHKSLTAKQVAHYRAKAAKYWADSHTGRDTLDDGREKRKALQDKLDGEVKKWLNGLRVLDNWDLRQLGAEGELFLIKPEWIAAIVRTIKAGNKLDGQFLDLFTVMLAVMKHLGKEPPRRIAVMADLDRVIENIQSGAFPIRGDGLVEFLSKMK